MFVLPNRDPALLERHEEDMFESVVRTLTSELKESIVAHGVRSIEYTTYQDDAGRRVAFGFHPVGKPQVPIDEFERVLAMRFVQILWEKFEKRCLPVGMDPDDDEFRPWSDGTPDYVLGREDRPEPGADALPEGLAR